MKLNWFIQTEEIRTFEVIYFSDWWWILSYFALDTTSKADHIREGKCEIPISHLLFITILWFLIFDCFISKKERRGRGAGGGAAAWRITETEFHDKLSIDFEPASHVRTVCFAVCVSACVSVCLGVYDGEGSIKSDGNGADDAARSIFSIQRVLTDWSKYTQVANDANRRRTWNIVDPSCKPLLNMSLYFLLGIIWLSLTRINRPLSLTAENLSLYLYCFFLGGSPFFSIFFFFDVFPQPNEVEMNAPLSSEISEISILSNGGFPRTNTSTFLLQH